MFQPLNLQQCEKIRNNSSEIKAYAPDARVLTTYYCGNTLQLFLTVLFRRFMSMWFYLAILLSKMNAICYSITFYPGLAYFKGTVLECSFIV